MQPLAAGRKRALLVVRALLVLLALAALASPARVVRSEEQAAVMVVDESASLGRAGIAAARAAADELRASWPGSVPVGAVAVGARARLVAEPTTAREKWKWDAVVVDPSQTNLADGVALAQGLFPPGTARHVVVVSDGQENRGSLEEAARRAGAAGVHVHTVAVAGEARPDVRVTQLVASQTRITEGATVEIRASVESSLPGKGRVRLFEMACKLTSVRSKWRSARRAKSSSPERRKRATRTHTARWSRDSRAMRLLRTTRRWHWSMCGENH